MPDIIPNLHPSLVHFPIALVSLSAFFHVAALLMRGKPACAAHCAVLAHSTLWLAAPAALVAVIFGWQAFNSVHHDDASHAAMLVHRSWALGTLAVLAVLAAWDAWRSKVNALPDWWFAVALVGAWAMVAVTAWHGGELVYRHGLGVMALPAAAQGEGQPHRHPAVTRDGTPAAVPAAEKHEVHEHAAAESSPATEHNHSAHEH